MACSCNPEAHPAACSPAPSSRSRTPRPAPAPGAGAPRGPGRACGPRARAPRSASPACVCCRKLSICKLFFAKLRSLQSFGGLVLRCIKTKFRNKICVRQHFSSSARFAPLQSQIFHKKSVWKNSNFRENSAKSLQMLQNLQKFANFQKIKLVEFARICENFQKFCENLIRNFSNRSFVKNLRLQRCKKMQIL